MKKILTLFFLLVCATGVQAQLLWKISGNGLAKPSYVVGTYHVAPVSFVDSIPGLKAALDECEQVYGELDMAEMQDMGALMKMQQAMLLPEGQQLDKLLTADQMNRLNTYMKELMGVDMTNPMVAGQMNRMKPAAIEAQFQMLYCIKNTPGFDPQNLFDSYFQKAAAEKGKAVGGLETMEFQTKVLYLDKSIERQVETLMCAIDNKAFGEQVMDLTTKAFFAQNLDGIKDAMDMKLGTGCDATPEEEEALIYGRNAAWAEKLPAIMQAKPTFLAVGAAHLPGERGLLALLKQAGYDVTPVK